ncbi:MAG: signal peptidase I [Candidatus Methanoperedens sp.]|nr:signal peptidase I [Candidatus Methanoperedens sp.]
MISTISDLVQPTIPYGTRLPVWQNDLLSQPFFGLAIWHLLLFTMILTVYYDSRNGFQKSISIIGWSFHLFKRNKKKNEIHYTTSVYKEKSKKVYLSNCLVVVAVVVLIAWILYIKLIFFTVVISDSMNPMIQKGDMVLMQKIFIKPEIGDIITFEVPNVELPVTHRIISISGNEIMTRGDANPNEDSWRITKSNILGEIVVISANPVIIKDVGEYFIIDSSNGGRTYGPEFNTLSTLIRGIKFTGFAIFCICILLYLVFSVRDSRRVKW